MKSMASETTYNSSRNNHQVGLCSVSLHCTPEITLASEGQWLLCIARVPLVHRVGSSALEGLKGHEQSCCCLEMETALFSACIQQPSWLCLDK